MSAYLSRRAAEVALEKYGEELVRSMLEILEQNRPLSHLAFSGQLHSEELRDRIRKLRAQLHPGEHWRDVCWEVRSA